MDQSPSKKGHMEVPQGGMVQSSNTIPTPRVPVGPPIALMQLQPQRLTAQQPRFTITSAGYPSIPPPQYGIDPNTPGYPSIPPPQYGIDPNTPSVPEHSIYCDLY